MAIFTETLSGGVEIGGISPVTTTRVLFVRFKEGNVVFLKSDAQKGKLTKIAIKKVVCHDEKGEPFFTIYVDTRNACFFEDELITNSEAIDLATEFFENQLIPG